MLWKSGFAHTNGPWEGSLLCLTQTSSGRHDCNIFPVYFIQQAYFLLPFKGKCLLPLRQFLSVAILFFNMKMDVFFYPSLRTFAFCFLSPNFSVLTQKKKKNGSTLLISDHCLGEKQLIICILACRNLEYSSPFSK